MTHRFRIGLGCLLVMAALSPCAFGALSERGSDLDEVVVSGARLDQVRKELLEAEDRFFRRYNELNTDDDFDVQCHKEARLGTRLKNRHCRANFEEQAIREEGQEAGKIFQSIQDQFREGVANPRLRGGPAVPGVVVAEMRRPEFVRHMKEVVSQNPELVGLLQTHAALIERYYDLHRKLFASGKP